MRTTLFPARVDANSRHDQRSTYTPSQKLSTLRDDSGSSKPTPRTSTSNILQNLDISGTSGRHDTSRSAESAQGLEGYTTYEGEDAEEELSTPPESPSHPPRQQQSPISLPSLAMDTSRKRGYADLGPPDSPRKLFREKLDEDPRSHRANHFKSIPTRDPSPFESFSTASSGLLTTFTSPNTSFRTEATSMSFGNERKPRESISIDLTRKDEEMYDPGLWGKGQRHDDPIEIDPRSPDPCQSFAA